MQANAIEQGQTVVVVDDIIATGAFFLRRLDGFSGNLVLYISLIYRWIRDCSWRPGHEARRQTAPIYLHRRTRFPQG